MPKFFNYSAIFKNRVGFAGGIGFLIKQGVQYQSVNLVPYQSGYLKVQAIKVITTNQQKTNILNMYNQGKAATVMELRHYIEQLGSKYIIVGDLNAHSKVLDSRCCRPNFTGRSLEQVLACDDICLNNPLNMFTYISPNSGKRSCLDLSLSSPNLAPYIQVTTTTDVGSDHVPVKVLVDVEPIKIDVKIPLKWKINENNLIEYSNNLKSSSPRITMPNDVESRASDFISRIREAATKSIKQTKGEIKLRKKRTAWWDAKCSKAVAERRKARRALEKHPTQQNLQVYKEKSINARNICKARKKVISRIYRVRTP